MRSGLPVTALTACGLAVLAAFLPWITLQGTFHVTSTSVQGAPLGVSQSLADAFAKTLGPMIITANGWNGNVSLIGIPLPTWLVPAAALFVAALALMGLAPNTRVPRGLPLFFCCFGLMQLILLGAISVASGQDGKGTLEAGWYVALFAFLWMLGALIRERTPSSDAPAGAAPQAVP